MIEGLGVMPLSANPCFSSSGPVLDCTSRVRGVPKINGVAMRTFPLGFSVELHMWPPNAGGVCRNDTVVPFGPPKGLRFAESSSCPS